MKIEIERKRECVMKIERERKRESVCDEDRDSECVCVLISGYIYIYIARIVSIVGFAIVYAGAEFVPCRISIYRIYIYI